MIVAPITGRLDARETLKRMLVNTGLAISSDNGSVIVLRPAQRSLLVPIRQEVAPVPRQVESAPVTSAAVAPSESAPSVDEIVVTGARASVGSALQARRTATVLQESIVAEDIGKLPDNNVVESLQHVTGVAILRNTVEANTVLIRGLPDVATTLNGRQIFTSSSRSISLPDLPAELLARVDVKKSPSADDLEGGIAGLIDVTLRRPFDFRKAQVAASVKATYGSLAKKFSPQGSLLLSNRWDTPIGEIGFLVNASYFDRFGSTDRLQNQNQPWLNFRAGVADVGTGPAVGVPAGSIAYPGTLLLGESDSEIKRSTVSSSLQWRPSPTLEAYVDYFYAGLRQFNENHVEVILLNTCPGRTGNAAFPGTNIGQILPSGCYGLTSMQASKVNEDTHQFAAGLNWEASDRLTVKTQASFTMSKDTTLSLIPDANFNYGPGGVIVTVNPNNDGGYNVDQPGNPQMSPNSYVTQFRDTFTPRKGHEYAGRIDANYKVSDGSLIRSVDVGYRYNDRAAENDSIVFAPNCASTIGNGLVGGSDPYNNLQIQALNSPYCTAYRNATLPQPYRNQAAITSVGGVSYADLGTGAYTPTPRSFFGGKYGTTGWVDIDANWLFDNLEKVRNGFGYSGQQPFIPSLHFDVEERAHAFYGKTNYRAEFDNGMSLDGNVGVRVIKTTLTEGGFSSLYVPLDSTRAANAGANATCITCLVYTRKVGSRSDTQVLPSFNARLDLTSGFYLRGAVSKTVTRPTFAQLNPGETVAAATATIRGTITSGNPDLNPILSTNYDFDLTRYWGTANHIGISLFYRKVKGYIQTRSTSVIIDGLDYARNRPENYQDATIKGVEGGYSQFLDFLPGIWGGFGWDVNATYLEAPFNNVPKFHANLTGIYEKGPVSLRLSYTYNSPYRVADFPRGVQPQDTWASVRENMDFSASYRLNQHLSASFDITNLLDNYQRQHAGKGGENALLYPTALNRFDRTYGLTIRYKM